MRVAIVQKINNQKSAVVLLISFIVEPPKLGWFWVIFGVMVLWRHSVFLVAFRVTVEIDEKHSGFLKDLGRFLMDF